MRCSKCVNCEKDQFQKVQLSLIFNRFARWGVPNVCSCIGIWKSLLLSENPASFASSHKLLIEISPICSSEKIHQNYFQNYKIEKLGWLHNILYFYTLLKLPSSFCLLKVKVTLLTVGHTKGSLLVINFIISDDLVFGVFWGSFGCHF